MLDTQVTASNSPFHPSSFSGWKSFSLLLIFSFIVSLFLLHSSKALAAEPATKTHALTPYSAKYLAFRNGSEIGFAEMDLEATSHNQYRLRFYSDASLFLIYDKREEISVFSLQNDQFLPLTYAFDKRGTFKDEKLKLVFNRAENQILVNDKKTMAWQQELDHQLYRLAAQRRLEAGEQAFEFDLINYRGQQKHYGFQVEGLEELTLPFGKLNAIKLKTIRQSKKRVTYSWFAPELDYLLVRIQQFKEGNEQGDIRLSEYSLQK